MNTHRILLAALAIALIGVAIYKENTKNHVDYVGTVNHPRGSVTVQTTVQGNGAVVRYAFNVEPHRRASDLLARSDFIAAETVLREIIERTPDELIAWHELGATLYAQRRYREAGEVFQHILTQEPRNFKARDGLGAVHSISGRYAESVAEFSLALEESPDDFLAFYGRGIAYARWGKRAEALADLRRVLELLPPDADLAQRAKLNMEHVSALATQQADQGR